MPADSHVSVCANIRQDFDAIRKLRCSTKIVVPENANEALSLVLQNLNAVVERHCDVSAKKWRWGSCMLMRSLQLFRLPVVLSRRLTCLANATSYAPQ